jgi:type IV pilus assembly protein PilY1
MSARKVVKQTAWIDPLRAANTDQARFGLTYFSGNISNSAQIIVPFGPDKPNTFPTNLTRMVQARQLILDAVNHVWPSGVTLPAMASGSTPMATALFRVAQYFSSANLFTSLFGSSYELSAFAQGTSGAMRASWATSNPNQCSICWGCQSNAVILITDGSPNSEGSLPTAIKSNAQSVYQASFNCGPNQTTNCSGTTTSNCCSPSDSTSNPPSYVPRVADWMHVTDLRTDLSLNDPQTVVVSTVSFNLPAGKAQTILQASANMGAGLYSNAADGRDLANSVARAVEAIVTRANSFSAPAASSLSTIQAISSNVYVTRFKPNDTPFWEGHLFQANLFDEFLMGCDPTKHPNAQPTVQCGPRTVSANFNGDADGNGNSICTGVFMVDLDCDEIIEDATTGDFLKKGSGGRPANMVWDAGKVLSDPTQTGYRTALEGQSNSRVIYTAIPNASGGYDTIPFDTQTANLSRFQPFMNLTQDWCLNVLRLARLCGVSGTPACPTVGATWPASATTQCAEQVVHYVRGWDVLDNDADGCFGPGNPANTTACASGLNGEQRDRRNDSRTQSPVFWKLGDIFHSSPVVSKPPIVEPVCDTGYENQCVATLHSPGFFSDQTAIATYDSSVCHPGSDAYEAYRYDNRDRRRIILIGANDGMVHAFDAGTALTGQPRDAYCNAPFTVGTGEERWAFVPPDMLPRIKDTLLGHQYMVDGSTMVRDVWVDGGASGTGSKDQVKQRNEYHTVAISTERAGSTQFNALDITSPDSPRFLWSFPPPFSADSRWMGQSWSDFAPRPPPIGPVKIRLPSGGHDAQGRDYEERWVAMINGGYDPTLGAGRAVWTVDVWTGSVVWRFTDDDFKAQNSFGSGTSMFPVPGAVAMVDLGDPSRPRYDSDGYFDTATWGDLGGNLFVARFLEPADLDPSTGLATNWRAARTFEEQRRTDDLQYASGRSSLYYMTSNAYDPQSRALHTYIGTGNREQIMQQGEVCAPDNLISCCRQGCAVGATTSDVYGTCGSYSNGFQCTSSGQYLFSATGDVSACATSGACGASTTSGSFSSSVSLQFTCPSVSAATVSGGITCAADGTCTPVSNVGDSVITSTSGTCPVNRFFGVLAYGRYPEKTFATAAEAARFDRNRYTDATFTKAGVCTSTGGNCTLVNTSTATTQVGLTYPTCGTGVTTCAATVDDPGWMYQYGVKCPVANCPSTSCSNEKTGSASQVVYGCVVWNGFQPVGAQSGSDPCSGSVGTPVVYGYASDYISGVPQQTCGYNTPPDQILYRAQQRSTVSAPSAGIFRVSVSASGQVAYSSLQVDPGSSPANTQTGTRTDIAEPVYWLEVPKQVHDCRHDPARSGTACD